MNQLVAPGAGQDRSLVGEYGCADSCERDPAEAGDQWFPASVAFDNDVEGRARSSGGLDRGFVPSSHSGDRAAVFTR